MTSRERLSINAAAKRVGRDRRTIHRWLEAGMPSHHHAGVRHVWLDDLQAAFVQRLETDVTRPRSAASLEHGTRNRYAKGCRCLPCKAANCAAKNASYAKHSRATAERRAAADRAAGASSVIPRWSQEPF